MSNQEVLFRILTPTLFIAIMEAVFFFKITKADVENQLSHEYDRGNAELKLRVNGMGTSKVGQTRLYLASVNVSAAELLKDSEKEKKAANSASLRNAVLIILGILAVLIYLVRNIYSSGATIPWRTVVIQTVGTLIAVTAFQVYFYYNVGKKYNYASSEEVTNELQAKFRAESRLAGVF